MLTRIVIRDLNDHLTTGNYYSNAIDFRDNRELNKIINDTWKDRIEKSLTADFKKLVDNEDLQVEQTNSIFSIEDVDAQGATIWKSFVTLTDKEEKMDLAINFVVNSNGAFIYLGASHTHTDNYSGASEILRGLFKQLKTNEKVGHFFQTNFYNLASRNTGSGWLQKLFS